MATVNLGRIKPVFRGAYSGSTAYVVDDIVTHGNESFICIQAHGAGTQATSQTAYWTKLAAKGADGTDVATTLTTDGDILYKGSGALQRLAKGTAGQALKMNSGATAPEWGTISSGNYSVHAFDTYHYHTTVSHSNQDHYIDIAGGNKLSFTPTSTNDIIVFMHGCAFYTGSNSTGVDAYIMMSTNATIGSGDTKLNYDGQHNKYYSATGAHEYISKTFYYPCTSLTAGTVYYAEQAGARHSGGAAEFNYCQNGCTGSATRHFAQLIHYKKN